MKLKKVAPIHKTITGYDFRVDTPLPLLKTIRAKCLDCQALDAKAVRECDMYDCPNWPYRSGRMPK